MGFSFPGDQQRLMGWTESIDAFESTSRRRRLTISLSSREPCNAKNDLAVGMCECIM